MRQTLRTFATLVVAALTASFAAAQPDPGPNQHVMKGKILKYSQPIGHLTDLGTDMHSWGEDIPSDVDWHSIMQSPTIPPNWVIADDFQDPFNTPVATVRWWGSYVGPTFNNLPGAPPMPIFGPGSEDGYVISFFKDIPADPTGVGSPFSHPGELLGTYVLPLEKVWIEETPYIGWDQHRIFEYKANLMDGHLDHAISGISDQMGFHQRPHEIYWISIVAEVGHKPVLVTDAAGNPHWEVQLTGKTAMPTPENPEGHYWGWHTSPKHFNDIATMGHLFMPGNQWEYIGWNPIQPRHDLHDMAFELYTVPEPASVVLIGLALVAVGCRRWRFA
jgi:hypothetical protein